jgi:protein involved in polysaccharide export with SLBB domain
MENFRDNLNNWWSELHYSPLQKRSLAIIAVLVLATSAIFIMRTSSTSQAIPTPPLIVDVAVSEITIDIQGAVVNPGVYTMTLGSRVIDAIKASGGTTKNADPSDVNQARKLSDGERQLASLARAIVQDTPLMVLDEPASFLDYFNRELLLDQLQHWVQQKPERSAVFSSHDIDLCLQKGIPILVLHQQKLTLLAKPTKQEVMALL